MTIRVRDDDVLGQSSSWEDSLGRFQQVHNWVKAAPGMIHIPAIVVQDLKRFPEAIEYIKTETDDGFMKPEIHGYEHIDYGKKSKQEVKDMLDQCRDWISAEFAWTPTIWYTPWGASQPHLHEASKEMNIKLVDCSNISKMQGKHGICRRLMDGMDPKDLHGMEIFMHWWEGGARLARICEAVTHGSWEAAAKHNRELFK